VPGRDRPLPGEVQPARADPGGLGGRQLRGQPAGVQRDQLAEHRARRGADPGRGDAQRLDAFGGVRAGAGADVVRSPVGHHGLGPPGRAERVEQFPRQVFLGSKRPRQRSAGVIDPGRVGAEEDRGGRDLVAEQSHGDRQVVSLEAPRPRFIAVRVAEDAHPAVTTVPAPAPPLPPVEHLLQRDDRHGLGVGVLAQCGGQQPVGGLARGDGEVRDARAGTLPRPVFQPPPGGVVGERPLSEQALRAVHGLEQRRRGQAHLVGQVIGRHGPGIPGSLTPGLAGTERAIHSASL